MQVPTLSRRGDSHDGRDPPERETCGTGKSAGKATKRSHLLGVSGCNTHTHTRGVTREPFLTAPLETNVPLDRF